MTRGATVVAALGFVLARHFLGGIASAELSACRQPLTTGTQPQLGDCLYILQANWVFGTRTCETECICDVNGDGHVGTTDALICMRDVLGLQTLPLERCSTCFEPLPPLIVKARGTMADRLYGLSENCQFSLRLSIFLAAGGRGWLSIEGAFSYPDVVEVRWIDTASGIEILPGTAHGALERNGDSDVDIDWETLVIDVVDTDGDGTKDTGTASGSVICADDDFWNYPPEAFDVVLDLAPDTSGPTLAVQRDGGLQPMFTFADTLRVRPSRPLLRETLDAGFAVVVNGEPRPTVTTPLAVRGPFVSMMDIDPIDTLPFEASIGVDSLGVTDAWGRTALFNGWWLETVADPGPLTSNPGFEGAGGWLGLNVATGPYPFQPIDGLRLARVGSDFSGDGRDLVGYFDVPVGASALRFSLALSNHLGFCSTTSVALYTPGGTTTIDLDPLVDWRTNDIPWTRVSFDLTGARGHRAVFRAVPSRFTHCLPDQYETLALDAFRVE